MGVGGRRGGREKAGVDAAVGEKKVGVGVGCLDGLLKFSLFMVTTHHTMSGLF